MNARHFDTIEDEIERLTGEKWRGPEIVTGWEKTAASCERISAEMEKERLEYLKSARSGDDTDWAQWVSDKRAVLHQIKELARAGDYSNADHESALIQIALLISIEQAQAAKGHSEQCAKNGVL